VLFVTLAFRVLTHQLREQEEAERAGGQEERFVRKEKISRREPAVALEWTAVWLRLVERFPVSVNPISADKPLKVAVQFCGFLAVQPVSSTSCVRSSQDAHTANVSNSGYSQLPALQVKAGVLRCLGLSEANKAAAIGNSAAGAGSGFVGSEEVAAQVLYSLADAT